MVKFLKYLLASVIGCFIALFILFFIMIGMFGAMMALGDKPVFVKENMVLKIELNNEIPERTPDGSIPDFDFINMQAKQATGLNDILMCIKKAKEDHRIKGIYLNLSVIPAGYATVEEIRNALIDFKESGKFVLSYSEDYSQKAYYLATVADKVYLNPLGDLLLRGMGTQVPFFKNALSKLDIEMQIIRHGKFKSAVEPFMMERMSKENREQTISYIGSIWESVLDGIAESRDVRKEQLNIWIDGLEVFDGPSALKKGLIDGTVYYDEVLSELAEKSDAGSVEKLSFISLSKYSKAQKHEKMTAKSGSNKIAVIYAQGDIMMGDGAEGITSEGLSNTIRKVRQDSTVKAIVLRINSGGGSALASEIINREVSLASEIKPVIASFGDVAASGGYYIATQADVIVADPTTITGSIGVFGIIPNFQGFMNKKLGLTFDVVNTNKYADFGNTMRPLSADEHDLLQKYVENIYDTFLTRVATGRNMAVDAVDEIGQGRVWGAKDAKRIGLVDEFGGLNDAVRIAAEKAGLGDDYSITELPKQQSTLEVLLSSLTEEMRARTIRAELGENYRYYRQLKNVAQRSGIQARLPYEIELP
jgi:protease-4